jgi:hypothetical protein
MNTSNPIENVPFHKQGHKMRGTVLPISYKDAIGFLLPKHYSGRKPSITWAFGWYFGSELKAVVTFGKPASNTLCDGLCGVENSKYVYELNRLCRTEDLDEPLSKFVSACLRRLSSEHLIIVSYSDMAMNHNGYIYQACNFTYTGATKERLEFHVKNGHSRHGSKDSDLRQVRSSKHRYVFFATRNRKLKKIWVETLNYVVMPYPKGENKHYILGEYLKPMVVIYKHPQKTKNEVDAQL